MVPLQVASGHRPGLESRVTVWTRSAGVTFRVQDLDDGPILLPREGLFVARAGRGDVARDFVGNSRRRTSRVSAR